MDKNGSLVFDGLVNTVFLKVCDLHKISCEKCPFNIGVRVIRMFFEMEIGFLGTLQ